MEEVLSFVQSYDPAGVDRKEWVMMTYPLRIPPDKAKFKSDPETSFWHERWEHFQTFVSRYGFFQLEVNDKILKDEAYIRSMIDSLFADTIIQRRHREETTPPRPKSERPDPSVVGNFLNDPTYYPFGICSSDIERLCLVKNIAQGTSVVSRPIPVYCDIPMLSSDLIFTNSFNFIGESSHILSLKEKMHFGRLTLSCNCDGECNPETCECLQLNEKCYGEEMTYLGKGKVADKHDYLAAKKVRNHHDNLLVMCGPLCKCGDGCKNHIKQLGQVDHRFEIFRTDIETGFRTRVLNNIEIGDIVCEILGTVCEDEEIMENDRKARYSVELYNSNTAKAVEKLYKQSGLKIPEICNLKVKRAAPADINDEFWCINMLYEGNISRFINHGCTPNVAPIRIVANYLHPAYHHVYLMAVAPIIVGSELFLNYRCMYKKGFDCKCRSFLCFDDAKRKAYFDDMTADEFHKTVLVYYNKLNSAIHYTNLNQQSRIKEEDDEKDASLEMRDFEVKDVVEEDDMVAAVNQSNYIIDELETNIAVVRSLQNSMDISKLRGKGSYLFHQLNTEWDKYDDEIVKIKQKLNEFR